MIVLADDTRILISEVNATTDVDYTTIPVYGGELTCPTFTVEDACKPAYFWPSSTRWQKYYDDNWNDVTSGTFTSGRWRLRASTYIDSDSLTLALIDDEPTGDHTTHKFNKEDFTVTVNGIEWTIPAGGPTVNSSSSSCAAYSPVIEIDPPEYLYFTDSSSFDVPISYIGHNITPINVATGAEGGNLPYTFSKVSGPEWIHVSGDGVISGTPTALADESTLVVRVVDSSEPAQSGEITIDVAKTCTNPDDRTLVSSIVATTDMTLESLVVLGGPTTKPTFTVEDASKPAYVWPSSIKWQKYNGEVWNDYSEETFTEGTYRLKGVSYIDSDSLTLALIDDEPTGDNTTHMFAAEGLTVVVNEEAWEHNEPTNNPSSCSVTIWSPSYVAGEPVDPGTATGYITTPTFESAEVGYSELDFEAVRVTITSSGTIDGDDLVFELSGTNSGDFETQIHAGTLAGSGEWNNSYTFGVRPVTGLAVGTHTATLSLKYDADGDDEYETTIGSGELSFEVTKIQLTNVVATAPTPVAGNTYEVAEITYSVPTAGVSLGGAGTYGRRFEYRTGEESWTTLDEEEEFVDGKEYLVYLKLSANENYEFSNTCTATVNGEEAEVWTDGDQLEVTYSFGVLGAVGPSIAGYITTPTFTSQEEGYAEQMYSPVEVTLTVNETSSTPLRMSGELSGTNPEAFDQYISTETGILEGTNTWDNFFYVRPVEGLTVGTYTAVLSLFYDTDNDSTYETFLGSGDLSFTVTTATPGVTTVNCTNYWGMTSDDAIASLTVSGETLTTLTTDPGLVLTPGDEVALVITNAEGWDNTTYCLRYDSGSGPNNYDGGDLTLDGSGNRVATFTVPAYDFKIGVGNEHVYTITVLNGIADPAGPVAEGTEVVIIADDPIEGQVFDHWDVNEGGITLDDECCAEAIFTMGTANVEVEAIYREVVNWFVQTDNYYQSNDAHGIHEMIHLTDTTGAAGGYELVDTANIPISTSFFSALNDQLVGGVLPEETLLNLVVPGYIRANGKVKLLAPDSEDMVATDRVGALAEYKVYDLSGESIIDTSTNFLVGTDVKVVNGTKIVKIIPVIEEEEIVEIQIVVATGPSQLEGATAAKVVVPTIIESGEVTGIEISPAYVFIPVQNVSSELNFGIVEKVTYSHGAYTVKIDGTSYGVDEDETEVSSGLVGAVGAFTQNASEEVLFRHILYPTDVSDDEVVTETDGELIQINNSTYIDKDLYSDTYGDTTIFVRIDASEGSDSELVFDEVYDVYTDILDVSFHKGDRLVRATILGTPVTYVIKGFDCDDVIENGIINPEPAPITYSITIINGVSNPSTSAAPGTNVTITADAPAAGEEFDCWVINSGDITLDNEEADETTFVMISGDVEIEATYKPIDEPTATVYTVTFNGNGISGDVMALEVESGDNIDNVLNEMDASEGWDVLWFSVEESDTIYEVEDYYEDTDGNEWFNFGTPISGDKTLYAQFNRFYMVSFDANGGSGEMADVKVQEGDYTLPGCEYTAPAGQEFTGWDVDGTLKQPEDVISVYAKKTITAQWSGEEGTYYTVTFDGNGHGTPPITSLEILSGETIWDYIDGFDDVRMENSGEYEFYDWSLYDTNIPSEYFDFDTPISGDITLYAIWTLHEHTIVPQSGEAATCTASGEQDYWICSECGTMFSDASGENVIEEPIVISPLGHVSGDVVQENYVSGDCENGETYDEVVYCEECGTELSREHFSGDPLGHSLEYKERVEPTKTRKGMEEHWECTVCGKLFADEGGTEEVTAAEIAIPKLPGGGGGGSTVTTYKITTTASEGGTISPKNPSVEKNENQTFTIKANKGYVIADVLVDGVSVGKVNTYTFNKVTAKHTIEVKFEKETTWSHASEWAKEELEKADEKELIPETFAGKDFAEAITRKDFAAVAVKMYEAITKTEVTPVAENPFVDTNDVYVLKAYAVGITNGMSENTFGTDLNITREQMATMLTRGLAKAGIDTKVDLTVATLFDDDADMHEWGKEAIYFMAGKDIIKGVGENRFDVFGTATMEQALVISLRSVEVFGK